MKLSIIVVNWNTCALLDACLGSIYRYPCSAEFEVWVVDNASSDDSVAMVRETYPDVRLIENHENVGFARANNQAMARAMGEYFFLLNSDAELHPNSADVLVHYLDTHPNIAAVAPNVLNPDGTYQGAYARFPTLWSEFALITKLSRVTVGPYAPAPRPPKTTRPRQVDWISGAAFVVRREAYFQTGGFDEMYFMYSEETDWCWRLRQAGWTIAYMPLATVMHIGGGSAAERSARTYSMMYMSKVRFFAKTKGERAAGLARAMFMTVAALRIGMWRLASRFHREAPARQKQDVQLLRQLWNAN